MDRALNRARRLTNAVRPVRDLRWVGYVNRHKALRRRSTGDHNRRDTFAIEDEIRRAIAVRYGDRHGYTLTARPISMAADSGPPFTEASVGSDLLLRHHRVIQACKHFNSRRGLSN